MEACILGHKAVVEALLKSANIDLDAVNLRGQRAEDVALSRGHEPLAQLVRYSGLKDLIGPLRLILIQTPRQQQLGIKDNRTIGRMDF